MATPSIYDETVGEVLVRRHHLARSVRIKLSTKGQLVASVPPKMPLFMIKRAIKSSRSDLQQMKNQYQSAQSYTDGMQIGQSHHLAVVRSNIDAEVKVRRKGQTILATVPTDWEVSDAAVQSVIQAEVVKALRKEANAYAVKRLAFLSKRHGYSYETTRLSHAGTRWGSCSSSGTISLNIALMKLPIELIDYVLIHELCHTREMNHSSRFWELVEAADCDYKNHRRALKTHNPSL